MGRLTINDLAGVLVQKNGLSPKEATSFVTAVFDVVKEELTADQIVKVRGLGTFKIIGVEARESVNVNTGERVTIDGHSKITFTPDSTMKELVNKPFSQFETVVLNDGADFDDTPGTTDNEDKKLADELTVSSNNADTSAGKDANEWKTRILAVDSEEKSGSSAHADVDDKHPSGKEIDRSQTNASTEEHELRGIRNVEVTNDGRHNAVVPTSSANETDDEREVTGKHASAFLWMCGILLVFVLLTVAAYGGYRYAYMEMSRVRQTVPPIAQPNTAAIKTRVVAKPVNRDSVIGRHDTMALASASQATSAKAKKKEEKNISSKYEAMDDRVRTGAYRIVGTMQTVTVKKGETLQRISRRIFGEGMDCYIEAYNGLNSGDVLQEGQKIHIPRLELKKKKNK